MAISLSNYRPTPSTSRLLTRDAVPPNTDYGSSAGCRSGSRSQLNSPGPVDGLRHTAAVNKNFFSGADADKLLLGSALLFWRTLPAV